MTYAFGTACLLVVVIAIAWGVLGVRRALLPRWSGAPARLAEVVLAVGWLTAVAETLGSVGQLRRGPVFIVTVAGAVVSGAVARRRAPSEATSPTRATPRSPRVEVIAASAALAIVGGQWVSHVTAAFNRGMTHPDTLWYHAPFAARFVQSGKLTGASHTGLEGLATPLHTLLPLDSSMFHALAVLPYHDDFFSPLLNLGWAAIALLSAWCIARRHGTGAIALLGVTVVLGLPVVTGTQPGQAANDVMAAALCFAAVALLLEDGLRPVPTALAAIAAGIGIGTKLTVAVPVAVLTAGIVVHAVRTRRVRVAIVWCVALFASGGYWFIRNWLVEGNPTPWWTLRLGPIHLDATLTGNATIAQYLGDGDVWHRYFLPGLHDGLGWLWPLLLGLGVGGAVWGVARARWPAQRFAGVVVLIGLVGYVYTGHSGDLGGAVFVSTLRYLAAVLFIGFTLLAVAMERAPAWWRGAVTVALLVLVVANAPLHQFDGLPAWPSEGTVPAIVAGVAILVCGVWRTPRPRVVGMGVGMGVGVAVGLAVVAVVAGAFVRQHYLERRYVDVGLDLDYIDVALHDTHHERIAVFGSEQLYPMFGTDLTNFVTKVDAPAPPSCATWRQVLADGGFTYVVLGHGGGFTVGGAPEPAWLEADPAVQKVVSDGTSGLYRITGRLNPAGCA